VPTAYNVPVVGSRLVTQYSSPVGSANVVQLGIWRTRLAPRAKWRLDIVRVAEQFDGTMGRVAHLEGMGPGEAA
jgi:hypothetical protein